MITIHAEPNIDWHIRGAARFLEGLYAIGLEARVSSSRVRESEIAILLGTTCWRNIETDGRYLLVDRASWGDPEYVSLVWDGHGRRGNHMVPMDLGNRWGRIGCEVQPWRDGQKIVLCGQTETWSPHYRSLTDWYDQVDATHFRGHPAGDNPTGLPRWQTWDDVGLAVTLNSSVAVDAVMAGIPTVTMDGAAMAWDVTAHTQEIIKPDRRPWLEWLAWTQWHWDEIREGEPIKHLFEAI